MRTVVEKYLDAKKLDYHLDGNNAIMQCPFCKEGDKFGINIENWLYQCFRGSCGVKGNEVTFKRHFGDVVQPVSNLEDDDDESPQPSRPARTNQAEAIPDIEKFHQLLLSDDEVLNWLNDERGLSLETVKAAKLGLGKRKYSEGVGQALMFPYFEDNKCVGVKYRSLPPFKKDFRYTAGREVGLYRQDAIVKDMDTLILCEGESDTLALVNEGILNVVGVPGCKGKKIEWADKLDLPKKLVLIMDNDEPGQTGALEFATRFGIERFLNVVIPARELEPPVNGRTTIKDVNEFFLMGGTKEEFQALLDNAKPFDLDGVVTADDAFESVLKQFDTEGTLAPKYKFLWDTVTINAKGINDTDMIVVLAAAKTGKTTWVLNQTAFMAEVYGKHIHFDCMEMEAGDLIKKMSAMVLVKNEDDLTRADIVKAREIMKGWAGKFIFTRSSPKNMDDYLDFLRKVRRRYDIGVRVVDNFQILVDITIPPREHRPSYMSMVSKKLKAVSKELMSPTFLISQPKNIDDDVMVTVNDSEGSSTLTKDADLFFTLNRAKEAKMKLSQAQSIGELKTNQSHSENMYVEVGLSRRSQGGFCTLKIDGAKSIIREFEPEESSAGQVKKMIGGMTFEDDNEAVAA